MASYTVRGTDRAVGAIGSPENFSVRVQACSASEAKARVRVQLGERRQDILIQHVDLTADLA